MKTLRINDRGEEVKALQRALGITTDGIFGPLTEFSVKNFQRDNGLWPDGIVGSQTWAALQPLMQDTQLPIVRIPLTSHYYRQPNRDIRYLAIHYTAGRTSARGAARANRNAFDLRSASADYIVDDEEIVECNPNVRAAICWAVGGQKNPYNGGASLYGKATNANTVSIELCSSLAKGSTADVPNHPGWYFTEKVLTLGAALARHLMAQYRVPIDRVVRHYDITGKLCPGVPGWNDGALYDERGIRTSFHSDSHEWQSFLQRLR